MQRQFVPIPAETAFRSGGSSTATFCDGLTRRGTVCESSKGRELSAQREAIVALGARGGNSCEEGEQPSPRTGFAVSQEGQTPAASLNRAQWGTRGESILSLAEASDRPLTDDRQTDKRTAFRILIADDHEAVRRGLRSALTGAGWQVCGEAVDGRDAIKKNAELNPDLIVLDISMPNMSGLEAAREILKSAKRTKILIFTMHESKQIRDEAAAIGVHALAVKSAPLSTLLATIDSLFQRAQ